MAILSVDLAYRRYADFGAVVMERQQNRIRCELFDADLPGVPDCAALAQWMNDLCLRRCIRIILLDGPQGWKARDSGLVHSRCCERKLNTPAKTGEPVSVKPANYGPFVRFSISVYDSLCALGWERLARADSKSKVPRLLVESFPPISLEEPEDSPPSGQE